MNKDLLNTIKSNKLEVVSFVGGGGKTTNIRNLCIALKSRGKKVLSTTSTAIIYPTDGIYDKIFVGSIPKDYEPLDGTITVYGDFVKGEKLRTRDTILLDEIIGRNLFDYVFIEADGAQERPIKAPDIHEPVISKHTSITVGVIGMDSIGKRIDEIACRPNIFAQLIDKKIGDTIEYGDIIKLASHKEGIFKGSRGKKVILLNKAKDQQLKEVEELKNNLLSLNIDVVIGIWQ